MHKRIFIYKAFERFWHWAQALLIIILGISGFEIHGVYRLFGFEQAVSIHNRTAALLIILTAFAIFWHFTSGEWRQYIPTTEKLQAIIHYYLIGIFRNESHPFKKTEVSKLNPLQRFTYLAFKLLIFPVLATTGLLYFSYNNWPAWGINLSLDTIATIHTVGAFLLTAFFIVHVYMTTTGHTALSHLKAMIVGWEDIEEEPEPAAATS